MPRWSRWIGIALLALVLLATTVWGAAALWFDGPSARPLAALLAATFALGAPALVLLLRPWWRGLLAYALVFCVLLAWWLSLAPSSERDWQPDVAQLPTAVVEGDTLTIHNLRNFDYRATDDYTPRWETRSYDLSRLVGMDLYFFYWGSPWIAHTIMSWDFEDAPPIAISIETRKEVGEEYSAVLGFFRHFELYYVVADERDVVRLRTNFRGDEGYLFHLDWSPVDARELLLAYLDEVNHIAGSPTWYNAFDHNCTTTIRSHIRQLGADSPWSWRILANGKAPEFLYMRGVVNASLPFEELLARSYVNDRGLAAADAENFSERIREGLPPRPPLRQDRRQP